MDPKKLTARGIPEHSFFEVVFENGDAGTEHDFSWSAVSAKETVDFFGETKVVHVCSKPLSKVVMNHAGMREEMDVPEGCGVYQSVRSRTVGLRTEVIGRVVGLVKDGVVIEERFLDGYEGKVRGVKK